MSYEIKQLTPDLWVGQSRLFQMNSGIWLRGGNAILIDPGMYPDEINAIKDFLERQEALPTAIVLTHIHWDHILGPERFPGVRVIAQDQLPQLAATDGESVIADVLRWAEKAEVLRDHPFIIPTPNEVFAQTTTLSLGSMSLKLAHAPGHSPDMLVLYDDATATLWASDILSDVEIPGVAHSLRAYQDTLAMLCTWEIRALVPGHGSPTTDPQEITARIQGDIAYLRELRENVEAALRSGATLDQTQEACAAITYANPEEDAYLHRFNVETAFKELSAAG